jgi:hypothetical protein
MRKASFQVLQNRFFVLDHKYAHVLILHQSGL